MQARWVASLTFRSASKHVLFALGVDPTARDASESGVSDLVSQATPFAVSCGLVAVHVSSLHKSSIARHQANAVEFATKQLHTNPLFICTPPVS